MPISASKCGNSAKKLIQPVRSAMQHNISREAETIKEKRLIFCNIYAGLDPNTKYTNIIHLFELALPVVESLFDLFILIFHAQLLNFQQHVLEGP